MAKLHDDVARWWNGISADPRFASVLLHLNLGGKLRSGIENSDHGQIYKAGYRDGREDVLAEIQRPIEIEEKDEAGKVKRRPGIQGPIQQDHPNLQR